MSISIFAFISQYRVLHLIRAAFLVAAFGLVLGLISANAQAFEGAARQTVIRFDQATLITQTGERRVDLPNVLTPDDFLPEGSFVRYRLQAELPAIGDQPIGVYVPKISLSGRLYINGQLAESCAIGHLEDIRCLHQPFLFVIPAKLWRQGGNTLEFEVYATNRQMNGLSSIMIGDPLYLDKTYYQAERMIREDLLIGLAWLSGILGFLSLTMGLAHRNNRVYLWFGVTSIVNALASFNGFVVEPPVNIDVFNWFVFSIRLISVSLLYITFVSLFQKDSRWITWSTIAFVLLAPLAIWLSGNSRTLSFALYVPLLLLGVVLLIAMIRWTRQSPSAIRRASCLLLPMLFACGAIDWWRLGGNTNFEGIYLASYAYGFLLLVIWILQIVEVSEHRKLEAQLRYSESIFRSFFNLPLVGTAITSVEKGWVEVNDQTCEILGYTREELFKKSWAEITHPEDLAADEALFKKMLAGQINSYSIEKRFIRPDGTIVTTIVSGGRSLDPSADPNQFYVQILDITARKRDEAELIKARNVAETARHELQMANDELKRITAIQIEQSRFQEREKLLQDMHDGFGSQLASVRIMAEQGRLKTEQLPKYLQEITADLHLISDTLSQEDITLESAFMDMRYRLQRRFDTGEPHLHWVVRLEGMPEQEARLILHILRIMQEAFNNAIRHANPRNVWLSAEYDAAQQRLVISVRDDGVGIPTDARPGRGLSNMQQRAREIGATLERINQQPGTEIRLTLDCRQPIKSD